MKALVTKNVSIMELDMKPILWHGCKLRRAEYLGIY